MNNNDTLHVTFSNHGTQAAHPSSTSTPTISLENCWLYHHCSPHFPWLSDNVLMLNPLRFAGTTRKKNLRHLPHKIPGKFPVFCLISQVVYWILLGKSAKSSANRGPIPPVSWHSKFSPRALAPLLRPRMAFLVRPWISCKQRLKRGHYIFYIFYHRICLVQYIYIYTHIVKPFPINILYIYIYTYTYNINIPADRKVRSWNTVFFRKIIVSPRRKHNSAITKTLKFRRLNLVVFEINVYFA